MHNISFPELIFRRALAPLNERRLEQFLLMRSAIGDRALGLDLSVYDGSFFPQTATKPIDFAVQRISTGILPDTGADTIWQGVSQVGIRGCYHYFKSLYGWQAQADYFVGQSLRHDYHFYMADFESYGNTITPKFCQDFVSFCNYVASQTGKKVLAYYNVSTANDILFKYAPLSGNIPMWIAQWPLLMPNPLTATPKTPTLKPDWTMWQYSADGNSQGQYYGITARDADLDVFNGTVAQMKAYFNIPDDTHEYTTEEKVGILWREVELNTDWNLVL